MHEYSLYILATMLGLLWVVLEQVRDLQRRANAQRDLIEAFEQENALLREELRCHRLRASFMAAYRKRVDARGRSTSTVGP